MSNCWICGELANSKEHKFKASDIKRALGKKFEAYLFNGKNVQSFTSYKDDLIQFPKAICIDCNNNKTRKHDDAYDEFVKYAYTNQQKILRDRIIDFQDVYGDELWLEKKIDLYRYYAKHAGCKVFTSEFEFDLTNVSKFILGKDVCRDFVLKFELKQAIEILIKVTNEMGKYTHLYNSETIAYNVGNELIFGGWTTNNFITSNWVIGKDISDEDYLRMYQEKESVLLTDSKFPITNQNDNNKFSKIGFMNDIHIKYENGYNNTPENKINFFERLIENN
ncbi:hypothetical protein HHL23_13515 [Chryseobacterium sp. RP-3-3]|uniref:Uncharacterized protein n=1 Tax=Chryseobacterium antibioticum TaxID=2728847 RepID=A0A7Y0AP45_9FLAO|nr:hypothetical protein [Chryseobacterium antibioticum]NML70805.1 hypothetical protein [Chryseobacterium antibioticum]